MRKQLQEILTSTRHNDATERAVRQRKHITHTLLCLLFGSFICQHLSGLSFIVLSAPDAAISVIGTSAHLFDVTFSEVSCLSIQLKAHGSLFVSLYQARSEKCGLVARMYLKLATYLQRKVMARLRAGQQYGFITKK